MSISNKDLRWRMWDLDGCLADTNEENNFDLEQAKPIIKNCKLLRKQSKHWSIYIFTSRHWADYIQVKSWLKRHRIPFKAIICGKPLAVDYWDDKARNPFCSECLKKGEI